LAASSPLNILIKIFSVVLLLEGQDDFHAGLGNNGPFIFDDENQFVAGVLFGAFVQL
jgi:hypothetical protein